VTERVEPVELMARALQVAAADCAGGGAGDRLLARARSLRIMVPLSWRYINPGLLVAERLGVSPAELALTAIGGKQPADGREPDGARHRCRRPGRGAAGRRRMHLHAYRGPAGP